MKIEAPGGPRRAGRALLVGLVGVLSSGTALVATPAAGAIGSGSGAGMARPSVSASSTFGAFPVPTLRWRACGAPLQCTRVAVPLDWSHPRGAKISLSLARLPATSKARKLGTIFVNPGGPGASGVEMMLGDPSFLPAAVRARFDVVGFDPRFVGGSRPAATCLYDEDYARFASSVPAFPVTPAEESDYLDAQAGYATKCAQHSYLRYASTASVARDLELLRRAVGDKQLTYVGYSYGSYLGQVYAQLYPRTVRAMVIDGVLDAQAWVSGQGDEWQSSPFSARIRSAQGSSASLQEFFRLCRGAGQARCELATQGDPAATYRWIADQLLAQPIDLGGGVQLDYPALVSATASMLYSPSYWQAFAAELQALYVELNSPTPAPVPVPEPAAGAAARRAASPATARAARTTRLRALARRVVSRATADSTRPVPALELPRSHEKPLPTKPDPLPSIAPADNGLASFAAVTCADSRNPTQSADWVSAAQTAEDAYPYFGRAWTWSGALCATWRFTDPNAYRGTFGARTSTPILVIGNTFDPATPYSGAVATARRFPGARLLTVRGYGHTSAAMPSACVQRSVSYYLLTRTPPRSGAYCRQDAAPFR
ncbi:MAG: alpha/beta hydrolase [Kineosporiaceae bacterium]